MYIRGFGRFLPALMLRISRPLLLLLMGACSSEPSLHEPLLSGATAPAGQMEPVTGDQAGEPKAGALGPSDPGHTTPQMMPGHGVPASGQPGAGNNGAANDGPAGENTAPVVTDPMLPASDPADGPGGMGPVGMTPESMPPEAMDTMEPAGMLPADMLEPILPPIDDPAEPGPFRVERVDRVDGLSTHSLFVPDDVGSHGKHPVAIWTNGNGGSLSSLSYASFSTHVASHGFLVIADKASNGAREAEAASQVAAIEWALAENARAGGDFFERIDVDRIAVMGHSLGSLASFSTAAMSEHVAASIHFSGGLTDNPVGFDDSWLAQMHAPAAFLCGGNDATAGPSCEKDFAMAPNPVFYGVLGGASHIGPFISPRGGEYGRAAVAWYRWQLTGDESFAGWFLGDDCVLCQRPWTGMQRDLD